MIVVVESNFVLELTFRQDEVQPCERLLALAHDGQIKLTIPACSLFEPYETLVRRRKQRDDVARRFSQELADLARTEAYADLAETARTVSRALAESGQEQAISLARTIEHILDVCTVIPLTAEVVRCALAAEVAYSLSPQDAVVFASIDLYLGEGQPGSKLFATKNRKDFQTTYVENRLQDHHCKILSNFTNARQLIEHSIKPHR